MEGLKGVFEVPKDEWKQSVFPVLKYTSQQRDGALSGDAKANGAPSYLALQHWPRIIFTEAKRPLRRRHGMLALLIDALRDMHWQWCACTYCSQQIAFIY